MTTARFLVSGRVQGVAFRAHTRQEAIALGLRGRACNLADGRVEVIVEGDGAAVEALARWLAQGPPLARVDGVDRVAHDGTGVPAGFDIG